MALEEERVVPLIEKYVTDAEYSLVAQGQAAEAPPEKIPAYAQELYGTAPATPTTANSTRATAGSSAARSGSPTQRTSTSCTSGRSPGSAATVTPPTAPGSARKSRTPSPASLARGQWGIESVHWIRDTAWNEHANTGSAGNGPQAMATLRNLGISLLYLSGVTEITRTPGHRT